MFRERYGEGRLPLKPGVAEILQELKQRGVPLALASSTRSDIVKLELDEAHLLSCFDAVLGGDMAPRSKPEPDIFLAAAAALGAVPANCYVLEDVKAFICNQRILNSMPGHCGLQKQAAVISPCPFVNSGIDYLFSAISG